MKISDKLPPSKMPEHVIVRCALNLLLNSVESIKGRGRVIVSANAPKRGSRYTNLIFQDNGEGIRKRDLAKIYNIDFSTKGKKTGLGLFIVKRFLEIYEGQLVVESTRRKGTSITLKIPLS